MAEQRMLTRAENPGNLYTVYIRVQDTAGRPINGLIIGDPAWPGLEINTGSKGDGQAEWLLGGGDYYLRVLGDLSGAEYRSEITQRLSTVHPLVEDLLAAGFCYSEAECLNLGPGHYSYTLTFQKTW